MIGSGGRCSHPFANVIETVKHIYGQSWIAPFALVAGFALCALHPVQSRRSLDVVRVEHGRKKKIHKQIEGLINEFCGCQYDR